MNTETTEDISVHLWHRYFITVNHAYHARLKERPILSRCCCNGVKWSVIWVGSALRRSRVKILEYFVWRVDGFLTNPPQKVSYFPISWLLSVQWVITLFEIIIGLHRNFTMITGTCSWPSILPYWFFFFFTINVLPTLKCSG